MTTDVFTCAGCSGVGARLDRPCRTCGGAGHVDVDPGAIQDAIVSSIGSNKGHLRVRKPESPVFGAEYVWRMARFHGGADTTMPVMCFFSVGCHGIINEHGKRLLSRLDEIADEVAIREFGSSVEAASAWSPVLGFREA